MENLLSLAEKYCPCFMEDMKDPFPIKAIGYTFFYKDGKSSSCRRVFHIDPDNCQFMIEYAVFYDFDIQHLYDLEHVFVYVGNQGEVVNVEASFHGKFLKSMINGVLKFEKDTHPVIYTQPGKHAMMPTPEYFNLFIDLYSACNQLAGCDGFLIAPMFEKRLATTDAINQKVERFLKEEYSFEPSMRFHPVWVTQDMLLPYPELEDYIVDHMNYWVKKICGFPKKI